MEHKSVNYLEFPAKNIAKTQDFFEQAFGWVFTAYGPEYSAFEEPSSTSSIAGGFYQCERSAQQEQGSVLVVLYSNDLEETQKQVEEAGGTISKAIFSFPGGRRFHFLEPSDNELAVWSDIA